MKSFICVIDDTLSQWHYLTMHETHTIFKKPSSTSIEQNKRISCKKQGLDLT